MGDFPVMTRKGTFIINGTERVVVSQLVRSPGVYFDRTLDKTSDVDVYGVKVIPGRGAWLEFDVDKRSTVGVRIDRKRRQPVTVLLKALGWTRGPHPRALRLVRDAARHPGEGPHRRPPTRRCSTSTASCARASRRRASPRRRCWRTCSSTPSATTWPRSAATRRTRSSASTSPISHGTLTEDDIVRDHRVPHPAARRRRGLRDRRHRPLRQPPPAHGRRADPEPDPGRPVPHGARRPRADDDPGRRGDHAADPDQHPPGRRLHQGVLRHLAAVAVHGPDQPARRPDPQAPPVRARPGRSVP